jgi:spectinomycin phosphotransferase
MLEKPPLQDELILAGLQAEFGLHAVALTFLPLGYDLNSAVYRVLAEDDKPYFLKLRKGDFNEISVTLPQFLEKQGLHGIIAPISTQKRQAWGRLGEYNMILYPFIEGVNGYAAGLTGRQWLDFGVAMKGIHTTQVPPALKQLLPRETFSPNWRETVRQLQIQVEETHYADPSAIKLAAFMRARRDEISRVVERAEQLGRELRRRSLELVLCHADIHPGNLLVCPDGAVYIVDWDSPCLAPRERDLALIGGSPNSGWDTAEAQFHFYQGYSPAQVDRMALAYYRYERMVQDLAEFGKQLLLTQEGGEDREQSYQYFTSNFLPGHEIDLAEKIDPQSL